jgi:hypothetical protein
VQLLEIPDLPNAFFEPKWAGLYEVRVLDTKYRAQDLHFASASAAIAGRWLKAS